MKRFLLKIFFINLAVIFLAGHSGIIFAEVQATRPDAISDTFRQFIENTEGRFFAMTENGLSVLELIPAFGRLFASVGYYMEGESLYSYYAAELIPVCFVQPENCQQQYSGSSIDFQVRLFSNMSYAGNYWPGETRQRLSTVSDGLMLSNYSGDGDGLISKMSTLLMRNDNVPGILPYGPEKADNMYSAGGSVSVPEAMAGTWGTSWIEDGQETTAHVSFGKDRTITYLRDQGTDAPPLLLKGGFSFSSDNVLCYLMSSPASGSMPYTGCVQAQTGPDSVIFKRLPESFDDLLLPANKAETEYKRDNE